LDALIQASRLTKRFGALNVLKGITLAVREGEVVSVIGPSGSGKTTLLRCLALLEAPTEGEIRIKGRLVACSSPSREVRRNALAVHANVGMVFQHFNLWPHKTVMGNVIEAPILVKRMGRDQAIAEAKSLLAKVGLSDKCDAYPSRLSGGQQQRVAIARALAMKPDILLFDEPTSALDPELRGEVLRVMKDLVREGMTMLVATHEMGFAQNAGTRLVFMDQGQIIEDTDPAVFFSGPASERGRKFLDLLKD
jgi:ABC-type polar amino acid transport system ATPase subunit